MQHLGKILLVLCLFGAAASAQQALKVAGLPADAPLTLWASACQDALTLDVRMKSGWHLYATDVGGGQPVAVTIERGSGFVARGPLVVPAGEGGQLLGAFRLVLPLERNGRSATIAARFDFIACDPLECLPPMSVTITGELRPLKVLLVVDSEDARSQRIATFLKDNGMVPAIATYANVTASTCDAHDVVLADSKLFGKNEAGSVGQARAFPKTRSPIVAVGFLGTELIEGQGVAMTSGYI